MKKKHSKKEAVRYYSPSISTIEFLKAELEINPNDERLKKLIQEFESKGK